MNPKRANLFSVISEGIIIYGTPKTRCRVGFTNPSLMTQRGFGRLHFQGVVMKQIPLTQGRVALVDDEDFERLNQFKWCAHKIGNSYYAARHLDRKHLIGMHRQILNVSIGLVVDHINGDGLDNRRKNLRLCTHAQNLWNTRKHRRKTTTSRFIGVSWWTIGKIWRAVIWANGKQILIGSFHSEQDAAKAYDIKAKEIRGEFAVLNFPPGKM